jgi:hypothetical protein
MKYLKILGLATVTVAALMAFAGVGIASATVICKNNLNTETCSEPYPVGTEGTASLESGGSALLTDTSGKSLDTCKASTVTGKLKSQGKGGPARSELSTLSFSSCNFPTKTLSPGSAELHWIKGTDNGTLTTGGVEVTINTVLFGSCIYGMESGTDVGTTVGGNPGSLSVNAVVKKLGGGISCPETTKFTAKYVATSPTAGWVSNG